MPEIPSEPMTVIGLKVENYARLTAADLSPKATGLILVRGKNGAGKSSAIGAMREALGAEKSDLPIHKDAYLCNVLIDLGLIQIVEKFTRGPDGKAKRALVVQDPSGSRFKSPAAVLKELRGHTADPVAFIEMSASDQVKTVLGVLGLDGELQALEDEAQSHYDRRRDLHREADRAGKAYHELATELQGLPMPESSESVEELAAQLEAAKEANAARAAAAAQRNGLAEAGQDLKERIASLKAEIETLEGRKADVAKAWQEASKEERALPVVDVAPITGKLKLAEEAAKAAGRLELLERTKAEAKVASEAHAEEDLALEQTRTKIQELLAGAKFPIEGMNYEADQKVLTINGIPFSSASQAEKIKAAAAVAMAGSPKIRVIFAREGSLLDEESRAQLEQIAETSGFQLWLEVVDSTEEGTGVWIEDGVASEGEDGNE